MARSPSITRQKVWFTTGEETWNELDKVFTYTKPVMKKMAVSARAGAPEEIAIGFIPSYDRYITNFERDFQPKEGWFVYVDVVPKLDRRGELVKDDDGNYMTHPDYVIKKILDTQKGVVARYGISKRELSDE